MTDDRHLREQFSALRREDTRRAEAASRVLARVKARSEEGSVRLRSGRPWPSWAPAVAVAALALVVWLTLPVPAHGPADGTSELRLADVDLRALGSLRMPTDSLLEPVHLNLLGSRAPELLPIPALPEPPPVRESRDRRRIPSWRRTVS